MKKSVGEVVHAFAVGLRTSIRNNSSAYGFSILATVTLASLTSKYGAPDVAELFLFVAGAGGGFILVEALGSKLFTERMRGEAPETVVLGSAFNIFSISAALGAALGISAWLTEPLVWAMAALAATVVYVLGAGLEMTLAHGLEERVKKRG